MVHSNCITTFVWCMRPKVIHLILILFCFEKSSLGERRVELMSQDGVSPRLLIMRVSAPSPRGHLGKEMHSSYHRSSERFTCDNHTFYLNHSMTVVSCFNGSGFCMEKVWDSGAPQRNKWQQPHCELQKTLTFLRVLNTLLTIIVYHYL